MTDAERAALTSNYNISEVMSVAKRSADSGPPPQMEKREASCVDWIARGAQGAVKSQGSCGSCWTFGAMSPLEGNYYIMTGEKKVFSEQEYLDCAPESDGCGGGWMEWCYNYNIRTGHMALQSDVPYAATSVASGSGACKWASKDNAFTKAKVASIRYTKGPAGLQTALQEGIVTVTIMVTDSFGGYRSGVWVCYEDNCLTSINHAVSVVGYGSQSGIRYWNVRNSWGSTWGDGGYIKMTRDDETQNVANIHYYDGNMPVFECKSGQTCTKPDWDESSHEDDDIDVGKGDDVKCGIIKHSGGRCLSIDDSAEKFTDLSAVCEREWCTTTKGYLYEKATDLCANMVNTVADCRDNSNSCKYWASLGYCEHTYVGYMEGTCASSCKLCGARVRLQGTCTSQWHFTSDGAIKNAATTKCLHAEGATPEEGTPLNPDTTCTATFSFKKVTCWEVEQGKKLTGNQVACEDKYSSCGYWSDQNYCVAGNYIAWMATNCPVTCNTCPGYAIKSLTNEANAKEQCGELGDACGGINWDASTSKYLLVPGTTLVSAGTADKAMALIDCDGACDAGKSRCTDGECRADCDAKCDASAGMRECPNGTCRHEHMAC